VGLVKNTVVVNRPIEEVWDWFLVWPNTPRWYKSLAECKQVSKGPVGKGTVVKLVPRFGPRGPVQIIEFEPSRLIVFQGVGGLYKSLTTSFIFEPVESGTRFTKSEDYRGLLKPLSWVAPRLQKIREPFYAEFERLVEAPVKAG
jgi:uncharacterized protein YndB with AHSA1/START domain